MTSLTNSRYVYWVYFLCIAALFISIGGIVWLVLPPNPQLASAPNVPSAQQLSTMSFEQRETLKEKIIAAYAAMPNIHAIEELPDFSNTRDPLVVLARGDFKGGTQNRNAEGSTRLYQLPNGDRILRFEEFLVTPGPDLRVYLLKEKEPLRTEQIQKGFVDLGELKGNVGSQNYFLPKKVETKHFRSVAIYSPSLEILYGTARLYLPGEEYWPDDEAAKLNIKPLNK